LSKLARFVVRVVIAAAILWAIISVPLPFRNGDVIVLLRVPLAVLFFVIYIGKALFDTFFYERQP
jgi:hypothetical protein